MKPSKTKWYYLVENFVSFKLRTNKSFNTTHIFQALAVTQRKSCSETSPSSSPPGLFEFCTKGYNEQSFQFLTLRDLFDPKCLI